MNKTTVPVIVSRFIDAPPQRIYDAFPRNASSWLSATPSGKKIGAEIDPRYLDLAPGRRVVFAFKMEKYSQEETTVRIDIWPRGKGSKVVLTYDGVPPEMSARTMEGWTKMLEGLAKETAG